MATYVVKVQFEVGYKAGRACDVQKQMKGLVDHLMVTGTEGADSIVLDEGWVTSVREQSELDVCKKCGSKLTKHGYCRDETRLGDAEACPYTKCKQDVEENRP